MTWICPGCAKTYAANTHDGMCEKNECYGNFLEDAGSAIAKQSTPMQRVKPMEGLCVLVCDVSLSMEDTAFPPEPAVKRALVTSAIDLAIRELEQITKAENAYVGIVTFGERATLVNDRNGTPFIKSIRQIIAEFPSRGDLGRYVDEVIENDLSNVDRSRTNITAGLELAKNIYDAVVNLETLSQFGFNGEIDIMSHDVFSGQGAIISVPNIRIMAYSDGDHNAENGSPLSNPFSSLSPSPLMTAFIGDEKKEGNQNGANQMSQAATKCPIHGHSGYFLINSIDRHARLRNIFKMASGTSGFCPQCLAGSVVEGKPRAHTE